MKYFIILAAILLAACKMPGVGELEERVDSIETATLYDDSELSGRVDIVEEGVEYLDERVTTLESGESTVIYEQPEPIGEEVREEIETPAPVSFGIGDVEGLQDSIDILNTDIGIISDSIIVMNEGLSELTISVDSLILENDTLRTELSELQTEVADLRYTVNRMGTGTTGGSTGGSTGGARRN